MSDALPNGDEIIDSIKNVAGLILGVSENRSAQIYPHASVRDIVCISMNH
jgi:hypothetical protein